MHTYVGVAGAALGAPPERSAEIRRRLSTMGAGCFCMAGAALGGPQSHFAWQAQHSEHLSVIWRGRCSTQSTLGEVCGKSGDKHLEHLSLILRGRCSTRNISVSFAWQVQHSEHLQRGPRKSGDDWLLWVPAAFAWWIVGGPSVSWQVQHSEHLSVIWRGRCNIRRASREVRGSPATIEILWAPSQCHLRGRCSTRSTSREVRGPAQLSTMGAGCFAWQVQHLEDLSLILRGRCSTWRTSTLGAPQSHFPWHQHPEYCISLICCGRCSTRSTFRAVRGSPATIEYAALGGPQSHAGAALGASEHLSVILRGKCSTRSNSREVRGEISVDYISYSPFCSFNICCVGCCLAPPSS